MAGIFNGPARGGTRGGRDQFNWDNVKADRDREYYLGHSVHALTGRWQKGKDVYWYTRDVERGDEEAANAELAAVKQREADLMMEALGVRPKAPKAELRPTQLDKADMQKLLQGGEDEEASKAGAAAVAAVADADRIKGLGFHASMTTGAIQAGEDQETLAGVGGGGSAPGPAAAHAAQQQQQRQQQQGAGVPGGGGGVALTAEQIAEAKRLKKKQEKKAAKRAKKESKKAKKKGRKEGRKEKRRRSRSSDSSSSGGSGSDSEGGRVGQVAAARQFLAAHGLSPRRGLGTQPREQPQEPRRGREEREQPRREEHPRREEREEAPRRGRSSSPQGRRGRRHGSPEPRRQEREREGERRRRRDSRSRSRSPAGRRQQQQHSRSPARRRHDSPVQQLLSPPTVSPPRRR